MRHGIGAIEGGGQRNSKILFLVKDFENS
jgi:hypothetical protein